MLTIVVPGEELYDERTNRFINNDSMILKLEHSLVSISKWESKWEKAFLGKNDKTPEETLDYIKCMCIDTIPDDSIFNRLTPENVDSITSYINARMSATWITNINNNQPKSREVITAEVIYYWMSVFNIDLKCQKWHFNKLLTLIKVASEKSKPSKSRSNRPTRASLAERAAINKQRRETLGTTG